MKPFIYLPSQQQWKRKEDWLDTELLDLKLWGETHIDKKKYTKNLPESSKVRVGWWLIYGSSDEVENGEEGDYRCVQSSPHEEFFFVSPGQDWLHYNPLSFFSVWF